MAKRFGAMVVAAEHRLYGSSINDNGLHLDQLEHLSSQQGLVLKPDYHYDRLFFSFYLSSSLKKKHKKTCQVICGVLY